jgi:collagen beta-1,O-galactosyltransferase
MRSDEEFVVNEMSTNENGYGLIKPSYTHWTVGYLLSLQGAKKLVNEEPLKKLVPVDEYLPIMFDRQPK